MVRSIVPGIGRTSRGERRTSGLNSERPVGRRSSHVMRRQG